MRVLLSSIPLTAILFCCSVTGSALAQARDPAAAEAMFKLGREAMERGDHNAACARFADSQRLEPAPGTLLNLARCEETRGTLVSALEHYRDTIPLLPAGDERVKVARERASAIEKRLARLTLRLSAGAPAGTIVKVDSIEITSDELRSARSVDPGKHVISVVTPGRPDSQSEVTLGEGEQKEVTVGGPATAPASRLPEKGASAQGGPPGLPATAHPAGAPAGGGTSGPVGAPPPGDAAGPSFVARHRGSLIMAGIGVVAAGAGAGLGARAMGHFSEVVDACNRQPVCSKSDTNALRAEVVGANVLFGVAGAAAITSAAVFIFAEKDKKKATVTVTPVLGGANVAIQY